MEQEDHHQSPKVRQEAGAPEEGNGRAEEDDSAAVQAEAEDEATNSSSDAVNSVAKDETNPQSSRKRTRMTESSPNDPQAEDGTATANTKRARSQRSGGSATNLATSSASTRSTSCATTTTTTSSTASSSTGTAPNDDSSSADDFTCPLTLELCVDPVIAEDGHLYERSDIQEYIANCRRQNRDVLSPKTGRVMGPNLIGSFAHRREIGKKVSEGSIAGELAETYKRSKRIFDTKREADRGDVEAMERLAGWYGNGTHGLPRSPNLAEEWNSRATDAKYIHQLQKAANEADDAEAMYDLGNAYENGLRGLAEDEHKAYEYYRKSADRRDPAGMAMAAYYLLDGRGGTVSPNVVYGVSLMSQAATAGSDFACRELGEWHLHGMHGLPADVDQAKYWLRRATDGTCYMLHLEKKDVDVARECLEMLEMTKTKKKT